jgi:hypothetical protein
MLKPQDETDVRATEPGSVFDKSFEQRLEIECRTAYDFEHFTGCRLLFQGFREVAVAFLEFFEQPHVLDSNHGLIGEGLDQLNLPLRKCFHEITRNGDAADWCTFSQ